MIRIHTLWDIEILINYSLRWNSTAVRMCRRREGGDGGGKDDDGNGYNNDAGNCLPKNATKIFTETERARETSLVSIVKIGDIKHKWNTRCGIVWWSSNTHTIPQWRHWAKWGAEVAQKYKEFLQSVLNVRTAQGRSLGNISPIYYN